MHSFFPAKSMALEGEDGLGLIEAAAGVCAATVREGAGAAAEVLHAERGGEKDVWGVVACWVRALYNAEAHGFVCPCPFMTH
jgi:hypothetical protein